MSNSDNSDKLSIADCGLKIRSICRSTLQMSNSDIHMNPVRAGLVEKEEEYLLSSCGDFYGVRKGLLVLEPL